MSEAIWRALPDDVEPWAFERRRALLLGELRDGDRWVDVGCGAGAFTALAPGGIGVDVSAAALERARRAHPDVDFRPVGDDGTLPVGHGEADLVWCSQVIEHVPDALGLLQECRRVLAPGGRLLLTTPWAHPLRRLRGLDPMGQHVRFFTPRSLRLTLTAAGFVPRVRPRGSLLVARGVRQ